MARVLAIDTHPIQYKAPLYRRLQSDHGHDVTAFFASDLGTERYSDAEFGVEIAWDVDLLAGYRALFAQRGGVTSDTQLHRLRCKGLAKILWQTRPEVILFSGYTSQFVRDALVQLALVPVPWVFRGETTDHALQRTPAKSLARDVLLRALYRRSSALAYIGERSQQHYLRLGVPRGRLFFAPYAVETGPFDMQEADRARLRAACRAELQVSDEQVLLLFSGKLSARKDPTRLVHAVRALPEHLRARTSVLFLGAGELSAEIARLAAAEPRVDVRLTGFKSQRELSAYYHAADALVLTSRHGETWGLVVNEALHHGTPCLVSDQVGCAPDLIVPGETGDVFEAGSGPALTRAIEGLWPRLGTLACRERARHHVARYTLEAAACGLSQAIDFATRKR
ncbi:MAG TPA: glycosyltransferase family 4 protein [Polyangiales bacterium]|nr:glycosyltransferase family 4 protein [Polyangiales bacterium]